MSEIKSIKKVAKIMPGFDYKTGDLKAYDLQNTVIVGMTGSGVVNILNNVILNLIQNHSPNEVCVQYFSCHNDAPWLNKNRQIPHFVNQSYPVVNERAHDYDNLIIELTRCLRALQGDYEDGMLCGRSNVIVVEIAPGMWNNEYVRMAITLLAKCTFNMPDAHLMVVTYSKLDGFLELEPYFGLRIVTRADEETSNKLLGCNLASVEVERYGFAWVTEKSNFYTKTRLDVPYKPESLIRKVCKYLSNDTNPCYDAYRAEWELLVNTDRELNFHGLRCCAYCWNVTPIDDGVEYNESIKDYSEVQLCEEVLKGMEEHAEFSYLNGDETE